MTRRCEVIDTTTGRVAALARSWPAAKRWIADRQFDRRYAIREATDYLSEETFAAMLRRVSQ
jgi:hypothetical protein